VEPSEAVALRHPPRDEVPKEPLLRWFGINVLRLTVYLALASFGVELVGVLTEVAPAAPTARDILLFETVLFFLVGGLYGIPGTLLWLLLVAALPPEWSTLRRRAAALTMSPIIQVIWLTWFISEHAYLAAAIFGLFLPAGSALVVRLRGRAPSSPWPPDDGWSVSSSGAGPGTSRTRSGGRRGSGSRRPS
jgi:hypothetical protein